MAQIEVPERGSAPLPTEVANELRGSAAYWQLERSNIVRLRQTGPRVYQLEAFGYVGRATIAGHEISVVEKSPGTLATLLDRANEKTVRFLSTIAPATSAETLVRKVASEFIQSVREYASRQRQSAYESRIRVGSLVGGRLDITKTAHLWARGQRHQLVFHRNELTNVTPLNQLLLLALRYLERKSSALCLSGSDVDALRGISLLFSDCLTESVLFGWLDTLLDAVQATTPQEDKLVELATMLLKHLGVGRADPSSEMPRAWFINLERAFENACREILTEAVSPSSAVFRPSPGLKTFTKSAHYRCYPDIVVQTSGSNAILADVKYKTWSSRPNESDLYQLLVHARAYDAKLACLIFPGDSYRALDFGWSVTGVKVMAFSADMNAFESSMLEIASECGLLEHAGALAPV